MSGIDIEANNDIGDKISSLVRTVFSVTGDINRAPHSSTTPARPVVASSVIISKPSSSVDHGHGITEDTLIKQGHCVRQLK